MVSVSTFRPFIEPKLTRQAGLLKLKNDPVQSTDQSELLCKQPLCLIDYFNLRPTLRLDGPRLLASTDKRGKEVKGLSC